MSWVAGVPAEHANFQLRSCGFLDDHVELETLAQEAVRKRPAVPAP